ncbi:MAG: hypothetical protein F4X87_01055 [Chloroflexi bacterium]|nr:hypothetical protein [Chloroflexota bacterium]
MRSLPPKDYESLPPLEAPAGYICVIRDIDRDRFRIDGADRPATCIRAIMDEDERAFGIEFVSILETQDLRKSESELFERHHARLSQEWLDLDELQLEELRRSVLQIDAHRSLYLAPQQSGASTLARPQALSRYETLASSDLGASGRKKWREGRRSGQNSLFKSYGVEALRRSRDLPKTRISQTAEPPSSLRALIELRIKHLLWNDPGCLLLIWAGLVLAGLAYLFLVSIGVFSA